MVSKDSVVKAKLVAEVTYVTDEEGVTVKDLQRQLKGVVEAVYGVRSVRVREAKHWYLGVDTDTVLEDVHTAVGPEAGDLIPDEVFIRVEDAAGWSIDGSGGVLNVKESEMVKLWPNLGFYARRKDWSD